MSTTLLMIFMLNKERSIKRSDVVYMYIVINVLCLLKAGENENFTVRRWIEVRNRTFYVLYFGENLRCSLVMIH